MTRVFEKLAEFGTGRDNRQPFAGGTQMPTQDSKDRANDLLGESQALAEVGPNPTAGETDKTQSHTIRSQAVKGLTTVGSLPKLGSAMQDDPLVQYLKKHAATIQDNLKNMPLGEEETELQSEPADFSHSQAEKKMKEQDDQLRALFTNYPSERPSK